MADAAVAAEIRGPASTRGVPRASPADYFVRELSEGVGTIAAAFWPKRRDRAHVRISRANEYRSLLGGRPASNADEANPMLGLSRRPRRYSPPAAYGGMDSASNAGRQWGGARGGLVASVIPF
ncbi:hypothetical protein [Massilia sp. WF1]|uniref:hypothetical protein n=1 Tax=Massilia sp. WF1 TaxID=1406431 RepID=UPI0018D24B3B|nr:hypothetical protein [Massilia sp. WF1]